MSLAGRHEPVYEPQAYDLRGVTGRTVNLPTTVPGGGPVSICEVLIDAELAEQASQEVVLTFDLLPNPTLLGGVPSVELEVQWGSGGAQFTERLWFYGGGVTLPLRGSWFRATVRQISNGPAIAGAFIALGTCERPVLAFDTFPIAAGAFVDVPYHGFGAPISGAMTGAPIDLPMRTRKVRFYRQSNGPFHIDGPVGDQVYVAGGEQCPWVDVDGIWLPAVRVTNDGPLQAFFTPLVVLDT